MKQDIIEYITKIADININLIEEQEMLEGGKNGPYDDNETPVRICAHWIQIFSFLYNNTKEKKYYNAIKKLSKYLLSQNIEKTFYSYCCRNKDGKDHVNGTIGQAWVIEGLIEAAKVLKDDQYYDLAVKMFLSHSFDDRIGCWNRYEISGEVLGFDGTFNHQLWFAAAGSLIIGYKNNYEIDRQIRIFLDKCTNSNLLFHIHKNGTICHYSCIRDGLYNIIYYYLRELKNNIKSLLKKPNMRYKEEGYHYFCLYGFAILKQNYASHKIFKSKKLKKAVEYAMNEENYLRQLNVKSQLDGNKLANKIGGNYNIYCFPYNSPFYELPFILQQLGDNTLTDAYISKLWKIHQKHFLDVNKEKVVNTYDPITLVARIYELIRVWK